MTDASPVPAPGLDGPAPAPCEVAVVIPTYNNAATLGRVVDAARAGLDEHLPGTTAVVVGTDAGSSDGTPDVLAAAGLRAVVHHHQVPIPERSAMPFHGVPGRNPALRLAFAQAQRLGARVVLVLEADVTSITAKWIDALARPVWEDKADLVLPVHARHRYDGTITNLILAPLVRALYGRRLQQPFGSALALSGRLVEHMLLHPGWNWTGRDVAEVWIAGTAIAEGFAVWEAWLGPRRVESRTRTTDLPDMVSQTLGGVLGVMQRHQDLWREVRGSEPVPAVGEPGHLDTDARPVQVERMVAGFRLGVRDLVPIWELILTPDTLGDVLALDANDVGRFAFPDDLWARVVYEFALGHHYAVVHRDHLLRSLVPLYLGRTAAFVLATQARDAAATEAQLERVSLALERHKPYLVERWR
jgi:glycosyltransferase involved in cell wall biosynthesis